MELLELTEATNEECVERMCRGIRDGELMLFPTDTVYGPADRHLAEKCWTS
ncbi:MAG: hypothetical protein IPK53_16950 [bacterium]|nr:hypothetical protein [bacterium]